jgi:hypothetical protein
MTEQWSSTQAQLDRLESLVATLVRQGPAPPAQVNPAPPVQIKPHASDNLSMRIYSDMKMFAIGAVVAGVLVFVAAREFSPSPRPQPDRPIPTPIPAPEVPVESDFRGLGKTYRGQLAESRAASWELAATQLAAGVNPDAAFKAADDDFRARRERDFAGASAALEKIAPGHAEGHGSELAAAFRELAAGVRLGR